MKKPLLPTICFVVFSVLINTTLFAQTRPVALSEGNKTTEPFEKLNKEIPSFEKMESLKEKSPDHPEQFGIARTEKTAASSFRKDSSLCYRWDTLSNSWLVDRKGFSTYDTNGNQTSWLSQTWNGTAWVNSNQSTSTYDANRNQTSYLFQSWNGTAWVNSWQSTSIYDANGNRTSELYQTWNGTAWENSSQSTYIYDANGNQTSSLSQGWNGTTWINYKQYTYTYDANGNPTSSVYWNYISPAYSDSCIYYWSGSTGIAEAAVGSGRVNIYPNPFSTTAVLRITNWDELRIKNAELKIYDVLGRAVKQFVIRNSDSFVISRDNLPNGIYFYQLKNGKQTLANDKLVIQ